MNDDRKNEIEKTNVLHKKLEEKIQLILKYLPEEEKIKKSKKEFKKDELKFDEKKDTDDVRLSALIHNPESIEKKSLFSGNENNSEISIPLKKDVTSFKSNDDEIKNSNQGAEKVENRVDMKIRRKFIAQGRG